MKKKITLLSFANENAEIVAVHFISCLLNISLPKLVQQIN